MNTEIFGGSIICRGERDEEKFFFHALYDDAEIIPVEVSSSKKSKRAAKKRVVSVPIKDVQGSRLKGGDAPPPYDSWAWRKYGQKPIKGSPYPRGYYRCSSFKGCPARKQVERSRIDPTVLLITYSFEHNHPWPAPKTRYHHHNHDSSSSAAAATVLNPAPANITQPSASLTDLEETFGDRADDSLSDFSWIPGPGYYPSSDVIECSVFAERSFDCGVPDVAMLLTMNEDEDSLFSGLGELPEGSMSSFGRATFDVETTQMPCRNTG